MQLFAEAVGQAGIYKIRVHHSFLKQDIFLW